MTKLYFYDVDTGVFSKAPSIPYDDLSVNKFKELIDEVSVFKSGITDIAPEGLELHEGISPRFDEATQTWEELTEALEAYKAENTPPADPDIQTVDDLIQLMIMSEATTVSELQAELLEARYGVTATSA